MFKNFKALIENQIRNKIKVFRLDNEVEFISKNSLNFAEKLISRKRPLCHIILNIMVWLKERI